MIFDLKQLIKKYNINIKNIIHVGGHHGHEVKLYNVSSFLYLNCHNVALGSKETTMELFVETANQGQSNSLLKPKFHVNQYPHIRFHNEIKVPVKTLDSFLLDNSYNFISIDVQGFELEVLKGSTDTLKNVEYIIAEINNTQLYEGGCMVEELDQFLTQFNLYRAETNWIGGTWGDGFYIKR